MKKLTEKECQELITKYEDLLSKATYQDQIDMYTKCLEFYKDTLKTVNVQTIDVGLEATNDDYFAKVMDQNTKNQERMKEDRNSANKSVTRSYRLK